MGWGMPLPGISLSMSIYASYHKEQKYIWFWGGDLYSVRDVKLFELYGVGHAPGDPVRVIECILS